MFNILNLFKQKQTTTPIKEKVLNLIRPIYPWVYPDNKADEFISYETFRSWNYFAIDILSYELASSEIKLYRGEGENKQEIESHPVLNLLYNPNGFQTDIEFWWMVNAYLLSAGESPIFFDKPKNPTSMLLLNPDNLNVKSSEDQFEGVSEWEYLTTDGKQVKIEKEYLELLKFPNILTPYRGQGVTKYISQTLDLDNFTEEYLRLFFANGASLGAVLETDQSLGQDDFKRMRTQLEAKHKNYKKAHKFAILDKGMKWKDLAPKLNDLGIKAHEEALRDKILAAYRIPKAILGITDDVRANTDVADRTFARRSLVPRLEMFVSQLNKYILTKFSGTENMYFDYTNPVEEDDKLNAEINQIYINTGVKTINEVREELGLDPIEEPEQPEENTDVNELDEMDDLVKMLIPKEPQKIFTEKQIKGAWEQQQKGLNVLEAEMRERMDSYFRGLKGRIKSSLVKKEVSINREEEKETETLQAILTAFMLKAAQQNADIANNLLALPADININENTKKDIVKNANKASKSIVNTVEKQLNEPLNESSTITEAKDTVDLYFLEKNNQKVSDINATQLQYAAGLALLLVYQERGFKYIEWKTFGDGKVCPYCRPMDGAKKAVGSNFWNKGETMTGEISDTGNYPQIKFDFGSVKAPPLHPRCRCFLVPSTTKGGTNYIAGSERRAEARQRQEDAEKKIKDLNKREKEFLKKEKQLLKDIKEFDKLI